VHRVQRVPATEAQGENFIHRRLRFAIMPEAEEARRHGQPRLTSELTSSRSGGAGGQGVNTDRTQRFASPTTPSGLVVVCQDERARSSRIRIKAMKILRSRLYELEREEGSQGDGPIREKSMVGTGDRSERIRTYNFPQGRLTDHRIGLTLYQLSEVMGRPHRRDHRWTSSALSVGSLEGPRTCGGMIPPQVCRGAQAHDSRALGPPRARARLRGGITSEAEALLAAAYVNVERKAPSRATIFIRRGAEALPSGGDGGARASEQKSVSRVARFST